MVSNSNNQNLGALPHPSNLGPVGRNNETDRFFFKIFVPTSKDGDRGLLFKMMCPGNSKSKTYEKLLMLNDGTVNWNVPYDDFCQEKHVDIAINQEKGVIEVDIETGTNVTYALDVKTGGAKISGEWEINFDFYKWNNIVANFLGKP